VTVQVHLPPLLRNLAGGERHMPASGTSIAEVMHDLVLRHPHLARHVYDDMGTLRPNIVFLHDSCLVRAGEAASHTVRDGDEIVLTNALSGG